MKIHSLRYHNESVGWELERTHFNDLTLLVGASGVGKTQILSAIQSIKRIADGKSINGVRWDITFDTTDDSRYSWKGHFENKGFNYFYDETEEGSNAPKVISEQLELNGNKVINRDRGEIFYNGEKTVKLSSQESIVKLLKEEEDIAPAYNAFKRIIFSKQVEFQNKPLNINLVQNKKLLNKYKNLQDIRKLDENPIIKLYLLYKNDKNSFNIVKNKFIDIFPKVTDIKFDPLDTYSGATSIFQEIPLIQIKEKHVERWIEQRNISSGMFRTLLHIAELLLCANGTVILIDEFENSLGVNCIDVLTQDILNPKRNLQFIITSHHPYIINNIPHGCWKIITRKGGTIRTRDPKDFNFGKSKHKAFMQLINLEEFQTGIGK